MSVHWLWQGNYYFSLIALEKTFCFMCFFNCFDYHIPISTYNTRREYSCMNQNAHLCTIDTTKHVSLVEFLSKDLNIEMGFFFVKWLMFNYMPHNVLHIFVSCDMILLVWIIQSLHQKWHFMTNPIKLQVA